MECPDLKVYLQNYDLFLNFSRVPCMDIYLIAVLFLLLIAFLLGISMYKSRF